MQQNRKTDFKSCGVSLTFSINKFVLTDVDLQFPGSLHLCISAVQGGE